VLITTRGVFKFDETSKEMYLAGLHPGVTVDEIRAEVPWDLKIADRLETTPAPTEEEIAILRSFAPDITMGRKLQLEVVMKQVINLLSKGA
jgi:glutaconate CoA-transferase subunit B